MIDQTMLNIISLLFGATGLFSALSKYWSPSLNLTFIGESPFIIKQRIIDDVMTRAYLILAIPGFFIPIITNIFFYDLPLRIHQSFFYYFLLLISIITIAVIMRIFLVSGKMIAKRIYLPKIIENQRKSFNFVKEKVYNEDEKYISTNKCVERPLILGELFDDMPNQELSLKEQYQHFEKYFEA